MTERSAIAGTVYLLVALVAVAWIVDRRALKPTDEPRDLVAELLSMWRAQKAANPASEDPSNPPQLFGAVRWDQAGGRFG